MEATLAELTARQVIKEQRVTEQDQRLRAAIIKQSNKYIVDSRQLQQLCR
jgi:hypothetical protein